jgi:excisionase family DNA binding protein
MGGAGDYLTTAEAAAELGVTRARVDQFCREGRLAFAWFGNARQIPRAEVERFKKLDRPAHRPTGKTRRKNKPTK